MDKDLKRLTVDRRKKILAMLSEDGQVYVHELSDYFSVSEVTIRNDLDQLEKKNLLIRARGGAIKIENNVAVDQRLIDKYRINQQLKMRIGAKSAELINDFDTIIIDSGTTTAEIVKNLGRVKNLTVITNAVNIIDHLTNYQDISVVVPGGYLRNNSLSMVGPFAEKNLRQLHVDKVFMGVDGFDSRLGVYTPNIEEAYLNQIMIEIASEVILVADSSKFKRRSLAFICPLSSIDVVVTDDGIEDDDKKHIEEAGIKLIIASK